MTESVLLYRPVGGVELRLIEEAGWRAFPQRSPEQPIFYPVTNEAYAVEIARDWNSKHNDDKRGYLTRFKVRSNFLAEYQKEIFGGRKHEKFRVPVGDLPAFNAAIVGEIEVVAEFQGGSGGVSEPEATFEQKAEPSQHDQYSKAIWTPEVAARVERAEADLASYGGVSHLEVKRRTREMLGRWGDVVWSSEAWTLYQDRLERLHIEVGLEVAVRSRDRIEEAVEALARRPLAGRPSQRWVGRRKKSLLNDHKIILYRHDEDTPTIVYLADSRQDLDAIRVPTE